MDTEEREKNGKASPISNLTSLNKDGSLIRANKLQEDSKEHTKCVSMVEKSCAKGMYVKVLLDGLKKLGCDTGLDTKNICCEPCEPRLTAAFDTDRKEVIVCENQMRNQKFMDNVLTHELIHAYDVCRAKFDQKNLEHLACSSIRVANLTGDCFFWKENFLRLRFGWKAQHQECVRELAVKNMMCSKDISEQKARGVVDKCHYHDVKNA
uniref:Mitochondrial inner membrane protease ATP23 n=1 Tax=Clytia hemisphaerica TaxID=252671 RepID=A0A7M5V9P3_9CNID